MSSPTIYAVSSGGGRAGIAVIRISGARAAAALIALSGVEAPEPRRASLRRIRHPVSGETVDTGLVVWFPSPSSFTGEDVVELHLHGGPAVIASALDAAGACRGLRLAAAGEFTRRAFENGKLDLTAAEAVADLVNAETDAQRRQALRQLSGELGRLYEGWRERLINALAHMEASIDFSDEDLPDTLDEEAREAVECVTKEIEGHLNDGHRGERLREGVHIAIIGPPNAGKSSLLNLLARRDAAIVSDHAGTTRDVIEVHLDLSGLPAVVADTAGLREGGNWVEQEGVRRARLRALDADLRIAVLDGATWPMVDRATLEHVDGNTVVLVNKADLKAFEPPLQVNGRTALPVSVLTGEGIDAMMDVLAEQVERRCGLGEAPALTRARHREALRECRDALVRCGEARASEFWAEDLRIASRALGRMTGRVDVEEVLDVIFRDFCIGK